jgi:hypothetical protein
VTTWSQAANAARGRAATALAAASITKIAYDNAPRLSPAPASSDTWARVSVREIGPGRMAFGAPRDFEDLAQLAIELFVPLGQGDGPIRTLADTLRTNLAPGTTSDVLFQVPRFLPLPPDEAWARGIVIVDFSSHYLV